MAMKSQNNAIISISMDDKEQVGNVPTPQTNTSTDAPVDAPQVSETTKNDTPATEQSDVSKDMEALLDEAASLSGAESSEEEEVVEVAPAPRKKNGKMMRNIIYAALGVLVLGLAAGLLYMGAQILNNKIATNGDIYDSDILFIRENAESGNYALFDLKNGSRMTDFEFSEVGSFVNGYAYAKNDSGYVIYRSDGKLSVPAGKYDEIEQIGGAFLVRLSGSSSYSIIDGGNHVLAEYGEEPEYRGLSVSNGRFFIYRDKSSKYHLLNAYGEAQADFMCEQEPEEGGLYGEPGYVSCGGKVYMLDNDKLVVSASFELPETAKIQNYSSNRKLVMANVDGEQPQWFVVNNGKVHEIDGVSTCILKDKFEKSYVACATKDDMLEGKYRLVNSDGVLSGKAVSIQSSLSMTTSFDEEESDAYSVIDGDTYAYVDEKGDAHFYADGEEVKKVSLSAKSQIYGVEGTGRYYIGFEFGDTTTESAKLYNEEGEFVVDLAQHCGTVSAVNVIGEDYFFCHGMTKGWEDADNYLALLKSLKSVLLNKEMKAIITGKDAVALVNEKQKIISAEGTWATLVDDDSDDKATYELHDLTGKILATLEGNCSPEIDSASNDVIDDKLIYFTCKEDEADRIKVLNVETDEIIEHDGKLGDEHNEKYYTVEEENSLDYYLVDGTKVYSQPKEA